MDEELHAWQQLQLKPLYDLTRYNVVQFPAFKAGWTNLARLAVRDIKDVQKGLFSAYRHEGEWKAACSVYRYRRCAPTDYVFSEFEQKWVQISP
jgi:hypothetical protein